MAVTLAKMTVKVKLKIKSDFEAVDEAIDVALTDMITAGIAPDEANRILDTLVQSFNEALSIEVDVK